MHRWKNDKFSESGSEVNFTSGTYIVDDIYNHRDPRFYTYCPTIRSERFGLKVVEELSVCCAMRGRYNEDGKIEQQLEVNSSEYVNAITTVQKDCMILEIVNG